MALGKEASPNELQSILDYLGDLNPDALRGQVSQMVSPPRRALHILGVEDRAVTMAWRYQADIRQARQAALLHDITKHYRNQLKLIGDCDILLNANGCQAYPETLHALTGAVVAQNLGAPEPVVLAVRWHTTGRENMTTLEKIIYLADMTEPSRKDFSGKRELEALCLTDLDKALYLGMALSFKHIQSCGKAVDPHTARALSWITERLQEQ